jgi:hypothetical protein
MKFGTLWDKESVDVAAPFKHGNDFAGCLELDPMVALWVGMVHQLPVVHIPTAKEKVE